MNKLIAFFTPRRTGTFHLKSGTAIQFKFRNMKIERDSNGGLDSYSIEGGDGTLFYARLDDISAITVSK